MISLTLAAVYVLLLWWSLTGIVLYLDGLPRTTFRWSLLGGIVILLLAVYGLLATRTATNTAAVYCAFSCGVLIWGFVELTYLTGFITGTSSEVCPPEARGVRRFLLALRTSIFHELLVVATGVAIFVMTAGQPNRFAFWAFLVIWLMRWSTKLNAFFGVRNLNEDWLPDHLKYIASYMRARTMNPFFPVSVLAATAVALILGSRLQLPPDSSTIGEALVLTLLVLAIIEHLFLVLPLDATALWGWGMRSHQHKDTVHNQSQ